MCLGWGFVQFLSHLSVSTLLPLFIPPSPLFLRHHTLKTLATQPGLSNFSPLFLEAFKLVVLFEVVFNAEIVAEVDGRKSGLRACLVSQSLEVLGAFLGVEEGVLSR